jgi:peptidoglycan/LPS O-acetylase OafA/YrhL
MTNYIKGLNGLRSIAVICVIIEHWFPKNHILKTFPLGSIGVDIFFVLSGFLISRILFHKKEAIGNTFSDKINALKSFVFRRTLRIFPIYYLLLLFLYFTNGTEIKQGFIYYITYTTNYFFYNTQSWHGMMAHLWSLAVEEQFYLIWPIVLFFILKKNMIKLFIAIILISSLYALFNNFWANILTISCVNAFAFGGVFAYVEIYKPRFEKNFKKIIKYSFMPLLILFVFQYIYINFITFPSRVLVSIITLNIIRICIENNNKNILFIFLSSKIMNFIGMISYGIYLYHNPFASYWRRFFRIFKIDSPFSNITINYYELFFQFILLLLISYLSWILVERPILKLKEKF